MNNNPPIVQLFRPGGFGDLLMMTALFKELKRQNKVVRYVTTSYYYTILEECPYLDTLIVLPDNCALDCSSANGYAESYTGTKADVYVTLDYPQWWYYPGVPTQSLHQHLIDFFCEQVGISASHELSVHLRPEMREWAKQFSDCVLIQTKTAWSPYKNWPIDNWVKLCKLIQHELGLKVMQIGHVGDPGIESVDRIDSPNIRYAIAALEACKLFIGLDSVFNHASCAVKKTSIILWGSTNPAAFGYRQNINLVNGCEWRPDMGNGPPLLKCQPCYREYKHIDADRRLACPFTVPHISQTLPHHAHSEPVINACMATNTVEVVYHYVKKCLAVAECR